MLAALRRLARLGANTNGLVITMTVADGKLSPLVAHRRHARVLAGLPRPLTAPVHHGVAMFQNRVPMLPVPRVQASTYCYTDPYLQTYA